MADQKLSSCTPEHDASMAASFLSSFDSSAHQKSALWYATVHMAAMQIGPVLLSQPSAYAKCGLTGACVALCVVCAIALLTSRTLCQLWIHCKPLADARRQKRTLDYFDLAEFCVGPRFRKACLVFQVVVLLGTALGQIIGIGQTLYLVFDHRVDSIWFVMAAGPLCALVSLTPDFHRFICCSVVGVLCTMYCAVVILVVAQLERPVVHDQPSVSTLGFFQGLSTVVFTFAGFVVQPTVQASLKEPEKMFKGYCVSWMYSASCVIPAGIVGMSTFGSGVAGNVLYSLDAHTRGTASHFLVTTAGAAMVCHMLVAFGIFILPVVMYIEHICLPKDCNYKETKSVLLRVGMSLALTFLALMAPFFEDIQGLIGAISASMLSFICPYVMYLNVYWKDMSRFHRAGLLTIIAIMGVAAFAAGTVCSIIAIIQNAKTYSLFPRCYQC